MSDNALLDYMNADDEPTASEAAQAIAAALRRKKDLGTLGVLSGGRLAAPGQALLGAANTEDQGLMHATVARTARLDRKSAGEIAGLKDLRDFTARTKEQAKDDDRAERAIQAQAATAASTQALANAALQNSTQGLELRKREAQTSEDARKRLGEGTLGGLSALPVAERQVDELVDAFTKLDMGGLGGKAGGMATNLLGLQGTDTAEYNAKALQAMQAAGKIMEGGKLAAGDEVKYRRMLPQPGDAPEVVKRKAEGLKSYLRDLAGSNATALKQAGYNVPAVVDPGAVPTSAPKAPGKKKFVIKDGKLVPAGG